MLGSQTRKEYAARAVTTPDVHLERSITWNGIHRKLTRLWQWRNMAGRSLSVGPWKTA